MPASAQDATIGIASVTAAATVNLTFVSHPCKAGIQKAAAAKTGTFCPI